MRIVKPGREEEEEETERIQIYEEEEGEGEEEKEEKEEEEEDEEDEYDYDYESLSDGKRANTMLYSGKHTWMVFLLGFLVSFFFPPK